MALLNRMIRKFVQSFNKIQEDVVAKQLPSLLVPPIETHPLKEGLEEELSKAADSVSKDLQKKQFHSSELSE